MKKPALILLLLVLIALAAFFFVVPAAVESSMNQVRHAPPYAASDRARALHATLDAADLHADSLMWGRDLTFRGTRGHVDIPRLVVGDVALQVFTFASKTPWGLNIERNSDKTDQIFWLAVMQRWPLATWFSLTERSLYQANRLDSLAQHSGGQFTVIHGSADLAAYLDRRAKDRTITAGILGIEGSHALDGKLENLAKVYAAGYRVIGLAHFFDNDFAGSAAGEHKTGLTPLGKQLVREVEARRMIIDLAHSSAATINDVLALAQRPVIVSHTGVKGTCDNNRNLSDAQLVAIAAHGGLIGIGFWDTATCGQDAQAIARAVRYTVKLVGVDHVALGSDFDGAVTEPFDTTGLVQITDALLQQGFSDDDVRKIMGGNALRFFRDNLP
jgi:microsomal dipeptidase-like Zn-dependent dipeptidase